MQAFARDTRVRLIDIPGQEEYDGKSKHRNAEVQHVRRELKALQDAATSTGPPPDGPQRLGVAVITPYAAQARRLRAALDLSTYPALNVRIGIVDRFQGDEDQVVILTIAATRVAGFLKLPNRINVACSRAQDLLILTTSLEPALNGRIGRPLQAVAKFIDQQVQAGHPGYEITRPKKTEKARQTHPPATERADDMTRRPQGDRAT